MAKNYDGLTQGSFTATVAGPGESPLALAEDIRGGGIVVVQNDSDREASISSLTIEDRMIIWHVDSEQYQYYDAEGNLRQSDGTLSGGSWKQLTFGTAGITAGFGLIDSDHTLKVDTDVIADTEFVKDWVADHAADAHLVAGNGGLGIIVDTDGDVDTINVDTDIIADTDWVKDQDYATEDYVDSDFVIGFNYTNIKDGGGTFTEVASLANADDIFLFTGPDYYGMQFHISDTIEGAGAHQYYKVTNASNEVGYYHATSHSYRADIESVVLARPHITGVDVINTAAVGDTFTVEADTDVHTTTIKIGYGLKHDSDEIVVDTDVIADTDYVLEHAGGQGAQVHYETSGGDNHNFSYFKQNTDGTIELHRVDTDWTSDFTVAQHASSDNTFHLVQDDSEEVFPADTDKLVVVTNTYTVEISGSPTRTYTQLGNETIWVFDPADFTFLSGDHNDYLPKYGASLVSIHRDSVEDTIADTDWIKSNFTDSEYAESQNPYNLFTNNATPEAVALTGDISYTAITDTSIDPDNGEYQIIFPNDTEFRLVLSKEGNNLRTMKNARLIRFRNPSDANDTAYYMVTSVNSISEADLVEINLIQPAINGDFDAVAHFTNGDNLEINAISVERYTDSEFGLGITVNTTDHKPEVDTEIIATRDFATEVATEPTNHLNYHGVVDSTETNIALSLGTNFNMNVDTGDDTDVAIYGPIRSEDIVVDTEFFEDTDITIGGSTLRALKYIADSEASISVQYSHSVRINYSGNNINYDNGHLNLLLIDSDNIPASVLVQNDDITQHSVLARSNTPHYHTGGSGSGSIGTFHGGYVPVTVNQGDIILFAWSFRTDGANNSDWHVSFNNGHGHSLLGINVEVQYDGDFASLTLEEDGSLIKRTLVGNSSGTVEIADTEWVKETISDNNILSTADDRFYIGDAIAPNAVAVAQVTDIVIDDGIDSVAETTFTFTDVDGSTETYTKAAAALTDPDQVAGVIANEVNAQISFVSAVADNNRVIVTWDTTGAVSGDGITDDGTDLTFSYEITTLGLDMDQVHSFIKLGNGIRIDNDTEISIDENEVLEAGAIEALLANQYNSSTTYGTSGDTEDLPVTIAYTRTGETSYFKTLTYVDSLPTTTVLYTGTSAIAANEVYTKTITYTDDLPTNTTIVYA